MEEKVIMEELYLNNPNTCHHELHTHFAVAQIHPQPKLQKEYAISIPLQVRSNIKQNSYD